MSLKKWVWAIMREKFRFFPFVSIQLGEFEGMVKDTPLV
jgi:hypothetical protein